jgi:hypothetical protein
VLATLSHFFGDVSTWLTLLKYLGLSLAAGSSVWGTVNALTVPAADGRNKLTPAGRVSIALTISGLIISIVSEDLQRRDAARAQAAQVQSEANRTNSIIVAGQPLTSLQMTWMIQGLDADLVQLLKKGNDDAMAFIDDQQGERDSEQNGAVFRENQLYPFLVALSRRFTGDSAKDESSNVVVLFPLNDDQSAVIPFGSLDAAKPWYSAPTGQTAKPAPVPSIEIGDHEAFGNSDLLNWPDLRTKDSNVTIAWRLDPSAFAKSVNQQSNFVVPTAKLPSVLRIAILFDIKGLPFATNNFALASNPNFWSLQKDPDTQNSNFRGKVPPITSNFSSVVRLVPNNSSVIVYNYNLSQVYETQFLDTYGEAYSDTRCLVFEHVLQADAASSGQL